MASVFERFAGAGARIVARIDSYHIPPGQQRTIRYRWFHIAALLCGFVALFVFYMPYWGPIPPPITYLTISQVNLTYCLMFPVEGLIFCLFRKTWPSATVSLSGRELFRDFVVVGSVSAACWQVWIELGPDPAFVLLTLISAGVVVVRAAKLYREPPALRRLTYLIDLSVLFCVIVFVIPVNQFRIWKQAGLNSDEIGCFLHATTVPLSSCANQIMWI